MRAFLRRTGRGDECDAPACAASARPRSISPMSAAGRFDGFWERGLKAWDMAAGILLVREAGGVVTDLDGGAEMLETGHILAANEVLHRPMLELIRSAGRL